MHGHLNVKFIYNFFLKPCQPTKSVTLHIQTRIHVKQNDRLFLPELNTIQFGGQVLVKILSCTIHSVADELFHADNTDATR